MRKFGLIAIYLGMTVLGVAMVINVAIYGGSLFWLGCGMLLLGVGSYLAWRVGLDKLKL